MYLKKPKEALPFQLSEYVCPKPMCWGWSEITIKLFY